MMDADEDPAAVVSRAWHEMTRAIDRRHRLCLAAAGLLYFAVTIPRARVTPFWHDEIYTILLSRLSSVGDIWQAARSGVDLTPPLNVLLTRLAEWPAGPGHVVSRLPAMIGFCAMSIAVFYMVRVRSTVVLAFAAALVPWYTRAYRFSYEARGYGVMMALSGLVLWSWSEAARGHRRRLWLPIFSAACAASLWNHYFAVVTFVPVIVGETYRLVRRGAPDWMLWTAGAAGLACCAPLVFLISHASGEAVTYWRHARWADVGATYSYLFNDLRFINPWLLALLAAAVLAGFALGKRMPAGSIAPGHEVVAAVAALAIPALTVGLGQLTGAFTPRYALSGVAGFAVVVPLCLWWISRRSRIVELVLLIALVAGVSQASVDLFEHPAGTFQNPVAERPMLVALLHEPSPVIVTGAVQFLQLWYYAPPNLRSRLWYVASPPRALRYLGSDTADRGFIKLARWAPLDIKTYEQVREEGWLTLYDDGSGWLPAQLRDDGVAMVVAGTEQSARIIRVALRERHR